MPTVITPSHSKPVSQHAPAITLSGSDVCAFDYFDPLNRPGLHALSGSGLLCVDGEHVIVATGPHHLRHYTLLPPTSHSDESWSFMLLAKLCVTQPVCSMVLAGRRLLVGHGSAGATIGDVCSVVDENESLGETDCQSLDDDSQSTLSFHADLGHEMFASNGSLLLLCMAAAPPSPDGGRGKTPRCLRCGTIKKSSMKVPLVDVPQLIDLTDDKLQFSVSPVGPSEDTATAGVWQGSVVWIVSFSRRRGEEEEWRATSSVRQILIGPKPLTMGGAHFFPTASGRYLFLAAAVVLEDSVAAAGDQAALRSTPTLNDLLEGRLCSTTGNLEHAAADKTSGETPPAWNDAFNYHHRRRVTESTDGRRLQAVDHLIHHEIRSLAHLEVLVIDPVDASLTTLSTLHDGDLNAFTAVGHTILGSNGTFAVTGLKDVPQGGRLLNCLMESDVRRLELCSLPASEQTICGLASLRCNAGMRVPLGMFAQTDPQHIVTPKAGYVVNISSRAPPRFNPSHLAIITATSASRGHTTTTPNHSSNRQAAESSDASSLSLIHAELAALQNLCTTRFDRLEQRLKGIETVIESLRRNQLCGT